MEELKRLSIDPAEMSESEVKNVLSINPATWERMLNGEDVRPTSFKKAESSLADYVEEHGLQSIDQPEQSAGTFEFTAAIDHADVRFTAKGRPEDADLIREQVIKAVMSVRETKDRPPQQ